MTDLPSHFLDNLGRLRPRQLQRVTALVDALVEGVAGTFNEHSDFATVDFAAEFGDQLRLHHQGSAIPLTKDKFEYSLVAALRDSGREARKLGNGNPGADIVVDGSPWSLKTQADQSIKADRIHISKYMELGRGAWETSQDVEQLREKMFGHMTKYDRILDLRCLARQALADGSVVYNYELVEIPKDLLARAADFPIEMKTESRQNPKPASCYVRDFYGQVEFELYFDGGTERKLQVRNLLKKNCIVHATWTLTTRS